jgi:hypothetical protein
MIETSSSLFNIIDDIYIVNIEKIKSYKKEVYLSDLD